jgi:ANTAR domain/GAF domain
MEDRMVTRVGAIMDLVRSVDPAEAFDRLCEGCVRQFDITGAGVALIVSGEHRGVLGTSDDRGRFLEELQYTLGEGPCIDAHRKRRVVAEPNLDVYRWPAFGAGAVRLGVAAVFALPLQVGLTGFGALDFYRDSPGDLTRADLDDAQLVAGAATAMVLAQSDGSAGDLPVALEEVVHRRAAVHQAAGMVSVQLEVGVEDALVALRAHAYQSDRPLGDVADDVVARRLRLDDL